MFGFNPYSTYLSGYSDPFSSSAYPSNARTHRPSPSFPTYDPQEAYLRALALREAQEREREELEQQQRLRERQRAFSHPTRARPGLGSYFAQYDPEEDEDLYGDTGSPFDGGYGRGYGRGFGRDPRQQALLRERELELERRRAAQLMREEEEKRARLAAMRRETEEEERRLKVLQRQREEEEERMRALEEMLMGRGRRAEPVSVFSVLLVPLIHSFGLLIHGSIGRMQSVLLLSLCLPLKAKPTRAPIPHPARFAHLSLPQLANPPPHPPLPLPPPPPLHPSLNPPRQSTPRLAPSNHPTAVTTPSKPSTPSNPNSNPSR